MFLRLLRRKKLASKEFKLARILFADDDILLGDAVSHELESCGHQVTVADNGFNVLSVALRIRPDIIILDNLMPGLTAREVMPVLKRDNRTMTIPVLLLTSQTNKHDGTNAYGTGAEDYMTKPFSAEELADRVSMLLGSQQSMQQLQL
jgi:two-component system phosphate regulon response regulator PhoB